MVMQRFIYCASNLLKNSTKIQQIPYKLATNRLVHTTPSCFAERLYTDKHEWIQIDGKKGIIGITNYAQEALGDVVYAQLPDVGSVLKQKEECGALESVKAASEIYCPISGKVVEKNGDVEESPSLINTSCYDKGWLFKIELSNDQELKDLMNDEQYQEYLKSQEH